MNNTTRCLLATGLACGLAREATAQSRPPRDLAGATIEDLMNIVVTTASRAPEGIAAAPARVQVVTAAQIERRGYRSLLDVLQDLTDFKVDLAGDPDFPARIAVLGTSGASLVDAFLTIENALDHRYRTLNPGAYTNPEELIGAPQNPRRVTVGFSLRVR